MIIDNIKRYLVIYRNGARGDFLISTLLGDVLARSYQDVWISRVGALGPRCDVVKWHDPEQCMYGSGGLGPDAELPALSLDHFDHVTRIRLATVQDCVDVSLLAVHKMRHRNYQTTVQDALDHEDKFQSMDPQIHTLIDFQDLWDIDQLRMWFEHYRQRVMTAQEQSRVQHNIDINLALLEQLRQDPASLAEVWHDWRRPGPVGT